jgi:hypothetical protein
MDKENAIHFSAILRNKILSFVTGTELEIIMLSKIRQVSR